MIGQTRTAAVVATLLTLCVVGCGLRKPYPAKEYYSIDVPPPPGTAQDRREPVLRVSPVRIAPPFDDPTFHYKVADQRFEPDYYVNFYTKPGEIITGELLDWLAGAGPYRNVVDAGSQVAATRTLETRILKLYGDYTAEPRAVVSAKFFLLDTTTADARLLFERTYTQTVDLPGRDPARLVDGWSKALQRVFEDLTRDLGAAGLA